jgi:predicted RNA-binding protein YlxR (DUF448 family)
LIRLVRQPEGVQIDPTGKLSGRGAYLHNVRTCWEKGLKGPLAQALKTNLTPDDFERLRQFMQTLPEGNQQVGEQE